MDMTGGTLKTIHDDGFEFGRFISEYAEEVYADAALRPRLSVQRLEEAHGAWRNDLVRLGNHERNLDKGPDHFKQAAHLAFWLRRFCPITEAKCLLAGEPTSKQAGWRNLLQSYANEYIAFMIGYNIARYYEQSLGTRYDRPRAYDLRLDNDYIEMVCHFLKYKTVSPHALTMVYKSLYLG